MSRNMAFHMRHIITKVIVASLAYVYDMASGHKMERSSMSHMDDVIGMEAYLENIPMARGRYSSQGSCNHLEQTMRDVCLSGSSRIVFFFET